MPLFLGVAGINVIMRLIPIKIINDGIKERKMLDRKNVRKITYILFAAILFAWALQHIPYFYKVFKIMINPMMPLFIGGALAFVLNIPLDLLESKLHKIKSKKLRRGVSILITIIFVFLLLGLILFLIIPELARTFENLAEKFPAFYKETIIWFNNTVERYPSFGDFIKSADLSFEKIGNSLMDWIKTSGNDVAGFTVKVVSGLFGGALNIFVGLVFATYILLDKENLGRQVRRLLYAYLPEKKVDQFIGVMAIIERIFHSFVTGQLTEAIILGTMFVIAMFIFGFPYAVLVGILVAVTAIIPVVGAFIAMFVGAFLIFVVNPVQALWFIALSLTLQQIENNLIYPKIVGSSVGLPGIWVLASVMIGGGLFGVLGVLFAVPVSSVIYTLLKRSVAHQLKNEKAVDSRKYQ